MELVAKLMEWVHPTLLVPEETEAHRQAQEERRKAAHTLAMKLEKKDPIDEQVDEITTSLEEGLRHG